jgi:hypothetical protein
MGCGASSEYRKTLDKTASNPTAGSRPRVGQSVRIVGGEHRMGEMGTLIEDDGSPNMPFRVKFPDSDIADQYWFYAENVALAEEPSTTTALEQGMLCRITAVPERELSSGIVAGDTVRILSIDEGQWYHIRRVMTDKTDTSAFCSAGLLVPLDKTASNPAAGPRPRVGQSVRIVGGEDRMGETGTLIEDDGTSVPFKVKFPDSDTRWFVMEDVALATAVQMGAGASTSEEGGATLVRVSSLHVGDRVRRGPDWRWGDQDGGTGNAGTITEVDSDGWALVKWDKGGSNKYRTEKAGGTDLVKATAGEYVVSGAGGICASTVNGTYSYTRQHNGAPLYTKEGGNAILYYGGGGQYGWRINDTDITSGWYYSKEGSSGSVPCGQWTNDGYSGSDVLPCPTVARVGDDSGAGARPRVGATVMVLSASDSSTRPYVGQTGRLLEDDDSGRPFKVEFDDGNEWWFKEGELQKVGSLQQAAHRQTPWSGSVKCSGCGMYGPSPQTGPGGCEHCGLCSVCSAKPGREQCTNAPTTLSPVLTGVSTLCVGARVRVKRSVSNPTFGWGSVTHDEVGIVKRIDPDGDLKVDFPDQSGWNGKSSEMEVVIASESEVRAYLAIPASGFSFNSSGHLCFPNGPIWVASPSALADKPVTIRFRVTGNSSFDFGLVPRQKVEPDYLHQRGKYGINSAGTSGGVLRRCDCFNKLTELHVDSQARLLRVRVFTDESWSSVSIEEKQTIDDGEEWCIALGGFNGTTYQIFSWVENSMAPDDEDDEDVEDDEQDDSGSLKVDRFLEKLAEREQAVISNRTFHSKHHEHIMYRVLDKSLYSAHFCDVCGASGVVARCSTGCDWDLCKQCDAAEQHEAAAAVKAAADKAAVECEAAKVEAEELRRRATALGFLQMLTSLNVAEDATLKTAVVWCDEKGATSVSDIVECDLVDDFVRHLGLKPIPDRKLRTMLQALTTASSNSSPSPQLAWDPHKPEFYFVPRAAVLSATAKQLKRMQELRDSKLLEKMAVDLNEAFQGKGLVKDVLFVSHRWEDWATPDETGAQLAALKAHLMAHPEVQYIWFDYSCMPQRSSGCPQDKEDRTPAEKAEFNLMLKAITDMYLTAKVLILLDKMYLTRFWTTMEGWCAMQQVTSEGVRPATESESRVTVVCIHNATQNDKRDLLEMSTKTPAEMSKFLASPDVAVTNKKDKETMLPIVGKTDEHVREMMSGMHGR